VSSSFVHLHLHTEYSMLDGAARVQDVVAKAAGDGQPAVGITDHGNMYGVLDFYRAARDADVKPILGMEAYFVTTSRFERPRRAEHEMYHLTLLALTNAGYRAVCGTASVSSRPTPAQLNALEIRGQAMNQLCGDSTLRPDGYKALCGSAGAATRPTASELNALEIRGRAMNQLCAGKFASVDSFNALCGSGSTASQAVRVVTATGFNWNDFGIGAAAAIGAVLLAGGIAAGVHYGRSRHDVRPRPRPVS